MSEAHSPMSPRLPPSSGHKKERKYQTNTAEMDEKFSQFVEAMKDPLKSALPDKVTSEEMDEIMRGLFKRVPEWLKAKQNTTKQQVAFFPVLMNDEQMRKFEKIFDDQ